MLLLRGRYNTAGRGCQIVPLLNSTESCCIILIKHIFQQSKIKLFLLIKLKKMAWRSHSYLTAEIFALLPLELNT